MPYIRILRPEQWTKNLFLFAGLVFAQRLTDLHATLWAVLGFVCFCLLSSGIYVFNDIHDRHEDRLHPRKRLRPVASGQISVGAAAVYSLVLAAIGVAGALALDRGFFIATLAYVALQLAYTFVFKHAAILDVTAIALGFVLRAVAGAVLVHVEISSWLVLCTFTLCLFMGFSKRRCELNVLGNGDRGNDAALHRRSLAEYTPELLNHMTTLTAGIAVVTFMLYAADPRTIEKFRTDYLIYTTPIVVYAIFRFALLVEHGRVDGPTQVVLRDRPFQAALLLWGIAVLIIVYRGAAVHDWLQVHVLRPSG